jgi:hypothetical protein
MDKENGMKYWVIDDASRLCFAGPFDTPDVNVSKMILPDGFISKYGVTSKRYTFRVTDENDPIYKDCNWFDWDYPNGCNFKE